MKTKDQLKWLADNSGFSEVVGFCGVVPMYEWRDEGWLSRTGEYSIDDGKTLFTDNYPAWFASTGAIRVGRKVARAFV